MNVQPVVLPSDTLSPAAGAQPLATRLRNTDSIGVLINKIGFTSVHAAAVMPFAVRLGYQGIPITNGWIPIYSFCWPQSYAAELGTPGLAILLAKPIYLGPGEWIDVSFTMLGNSPTGPIAAVGHGFQARTPPAEKYLPYFASFLGTQRNVNAATGTVAPTTSTPQDIGNPFAIDLHVERLIGRIMPAENLPVITPDPWWGCFNVTLGDDRDNLWISSPTPMHNAFNAVDFSWRVNATLPARRYLRAVVEHVNIGTFLPGGFNRSPLLGMVGYRRIFG